MIPKPDKSKAIVYVEAIPRYLSSLTSTSNPAISRANWKIPGIYGTWGVTQRLVASWQSTVVIPMQKALGYDILRGDTWGKFCLLRCNKICWNHTTAIEAAQFYYKQIVPMLFS